MKHLVHTAVNELLENMLAQEGLSGEETAWYQGLHSSWSNLGVREMNKVIVSGQFSVKCKWNSYSFGHSWISSFMTLLTKIPSSITRPPVFVRGFQKTQEVNIRRRVQNGNDPKRPNHFGASAANSTAATGSNSLQVGPSYTGNVSNSNAAFPPAWTPPPQQQPAHIDEQDDSTQPPE